MEKKTISLKELKKRKMLLVLPVLILPFITMLFWSFGGGKGELADDKSAEKIGFNFILPDPKFKSDTALDKMSYYDQAVMDSLKFREQIKKDPNYSDPQFQTDSLTFFESEFDSKRKGKVALNTFSVQDQNEQKVYQKLKALQSMISQPTAGQNQIQDMREFKNYGTSEGDSPEMLKLEKLMSAMNETQEPDPELQQLGGMLENILDIQHPERMQEKLRQSSQSKKDKTLAVLPKVVKNNITSLEQKETDKKNSFRKNVETNAFYSLDEIETPQNNQNGVEAVIHETQTIVNGSTVKMRLSSDVLIQDTFIAKNSFLYGTASLKGERLEIKIQGIKHGNSIFPVDLSVYDMDGIEGIYVPGAISRDVAKTSADRSIQTLGVASLNDSWGAQAAGMGIEAAKSLVSKKVKLIKVMVKAGYQILLYDEKQKNSN